MKKKIEKKRILKKGILKELNKKIKDQNDGKIDEEDNNFDKETRDEIGNTMRPVFWIKKIARRQWRNQLQLWILEVS